jgi:MFS family permease
MVTGAALLGVTATYVVFSQLIDWFDWPTAFGIAALITALVGAVWALRGALGKGVTSPTQTTDEAERAAGISDFALPPETSSDVARRRRSLALLTVSYGAAGYLQYLFFYWMHYYFESVLRLDEGQCRGYSAMATLAMGAGMVLGGWLSDSLAGPFGTRVARAGLAMTAMVVSSLLVVLGITAEAPHWVAIWLALAMGSLGLAEGPFWVTAVEIGGRRGGFSASIVNTGGNAGGILAPYLTPLLSDTWGLGWQVGIAVGSGICFAGGLMWYGIDLGPRRPQTDRQ